MLELALFFHVIASVLPALDHRYANVASTSLTLAVVFYIAWAVLGVLAFAFYRPGERRPLEAHHV